MKNSILGFNQAYAITLRKEVEITKNGQTKTITRKIDCTDLVILRWFVDFYPNMKMMEVDGIKYAWLSHKKLLNDLPLIDITKRSFIDRMQKLVDFKILTYKLVKEGGTFSLYGFGENYINLVQSSDYGVQSTVQGYSNEPLKGVQSTDYPVCSQPTNKDNSIKDNQLKNNTVIDNKRFAPPTLEEVSQYCNERQNGIDPQRFIDYYTSNGWKVGRNPMKDWKAAIRTWESKEKPVKPKIDVISPTPDASKVQNKKAIILYAEFIEQKLNRKLTQDEMKEVSEAINNDPVELAQDLIKEIDKQNLKTFEEYIDIYIDESFSWYLSKTQN